ncbi:hypothetical protein GDO78_007154 [Eleutherodactylus coqui]|uniref:Uncharacterized protein n=1 Tax=Eleutherodactylus coqui TaxID=57060 RepID=A0A8J6KAT3_ELECQ|nr:hypothetical protein GDO78_007154 [Eleutherodactylus coqui]
MLSTSDPPWLDTIDILFDQCNKFSWFPGMPSLLNASLNTGLAAKKAFSLLVPRLPRTYLVSEFSSEDFSLPFPPAFSQRKIYSVHMSI